MLPGSPTAFLYLSRRGKGASALASAVRGELEAAVRTERLAWPAIPQLLGSKEDFPPSPQGHFSLSLMKSHCSDEASVLPPHGCWLIRGCVKKPSKDLLKSGKVAACSPGSLRGALCPLCSSSISPCFLILWEEEVATQLELERGSP